MKNSADRIDVQRLDLLAHARALVGVELGELAERLGLAVPAVGAQRERSKGWAGQIIERELGVESDGGRGPDFAALGIELKTVPVDHRLVPRESTAVCQIDPIVIAGESWETSTARHKLERVLFVAVQWPADSTHGVSDRRVAAVRLWSPDRQQERILCADFELFAREYFARGRANAITGHLGRALQVRPKGKNAADRRDAYDESGQPIRVGRMGFYLRPGFVTQILRPAVTDAVADAQAQADADVGDPETIVVTGRVSTST